MQQRLKTLFILMTFLFLVSCASEHEDLNEWFEKIHAKPVPAVRPLPAAMPYEAFAYAAEDLNSPFMKVVPEADGILMDLKGCGINDPKPDLNRRKEELEKMPINTLKMVGVMSMSKTPNRMALIRDESTGLLHRVKKGDYIGLNHGKIVELNENLIKLYEIVPNGRGCWESRTQTLELEIGE